MQQRPQRQRHDDPREHIEQHTPRADRRPQSLPCRDHRKDRAERGADDAAPRARAAIGMELRAAFGKVHERVETVLRHHTGANSLGSIPNSFLKHILKYFGSLNPTA